MDRLRMMEVFVRAAEAASLSEAARQLNLTPSAVSKQVSALEADLGVALLVRHSRGFALTEAGRLFADHARAALLAVRAAHDIVAEHRSEIRGLLRIAMPESFGTLHVAPHVPSFLAAHPAVRVELRAQAELPDPGFAGHDVAIRIGELPDSPLIAVRLAPATRVICASPSYVERYGMPATPFDLFKHNCLTDALHARRHLWYLKRDDETLPITVTGSLQTDNAEALLRAALEGVGVILLGTWALGSHLRNGSLLRLLPGWNADVTPGDPGIYAVYPRTAFQPLRLRAFIGFLRAAYGRPPYWDRR